MDDFGTVEYKGKTYMLTSQAAVDNYGTDGGVRYYANAVDDDGIEYRIAWDTTEAWDLACEYAQLEAERKHWSDEQCSRYDELDAMVLPDVNDESNACDWDSPVSVRLA